MTRGYQNSIDARRALPWMKSSGVLLWLALFWLQGANSSGEAQPRSSRNMD
ncbi:MAG TPA: hypothetical protein VGK99_00610 [Acidobacteriota bacterium]|jgi:hypothetical protein